MPTQKNVELPDIGDFDAVDIIEVLVKIGDTVNENDSIITLETDKATMEIPAPFSGKVSSLSVKVGDKVAKGDLILTLESEAETSEDTKEHSSESLNQLNKDNVEEKTSTEDKVEEVHNEEGIYTTQEALEYLERRFAAGQSKEYRKKRINYILDNTLLPHLSTPEDA